MKTVVISGGTSGIGKRLVELFLNEKMKVFTFSSKKKNVISFTKEFEEFKDNLYCYQCNIGDPKDVKKISSIIFKKFKKIYFLINNSGTNVLGPIGKIKVNDWKKIIDVNLTGPFLLTQNLFKLFKKNSVILNMGSIASRQGFPNWSSYCASKFGLKGFTESLREELRAKGVRVVHAEVGATDTGLWDNLEGNWNKESMMKDSDVAKFILKNILDSNTVNVDEIFLMPPGGIL